MLYMIQYVIYIIIVCYIYIVHDTEGSGVGVMVLYPEDGISEVQKLQMTSMSGGNVNVLGEEIYRC